MGGYFKTATWLLAGTFCAGALFVTGFSAAVDATNSTEFCTSCHSQQFPYLEYKQSQHFTNPTGVQAGCPDCHVPRDFGPKLMAKLIAVKDVYHELAGTINTKEKFEARRWIMANRVWRKMEANDSQSCRYCHSVSAMDLSAQDPTGRKKHKQAEERGQTCIECHKGMAHVEPQEHRAAT